MVATKAAGSLSAFLAAVIAFAPVVARAADSKPSNDLSFTAQCPKLLAMVDDFAKECREKARIISVPYCPHPFFGFCGKVAYDHVYVYYRAVDTGSHFGLGCTFGESRIDHSRQRPNIGIYYALKSSNFAIANTVPLDGAQGSLRYPDSKVYTRLELIRNFVTDTAGTDTGRMKNCEPTQLPDGWARVLQDGWETFIPPPKRNPDGTLLIKACAGDRSAESCRSDDYTSVFGSSDDRVIFGLMSYFVTDHGDMLIKKDYLHRSCPRDPNLLHSDLCELLKQREQGSANTHINHQGANP